MNMWSIKASLRVQMCMNRSENKEQTGDDEEDEKASMKEITQNTQLIILLWNKIFKKQLGARTSGAQQELSRFRLSFTSAPSV